VLRDLERRLRAVEAARPRPLELLIGQEDGTFRGPRGEQMTREEAEALVRAPGRFAVIINSGDAQL
jgi:hypothetical protein